MTSKPKTLQDIYTQNTGKRSEKKDHTWHFLEHGKMIDWSKKELSDTIKTNKKQYNNRNIALRIKDIFTWNFNENPENYYIYREEKNLIWDYVWFFENIKRFFGKKFLPNDIIRDYFYIKNRKNLKLFKDVSYNWLTIKWVPNIKYFTEKKIQNKKIDWYKKNISYIDTKKEPYLKYMKIIDDLLTELWFDKLNTNNLEIYGYNWKIRSSIRKYIWWTCFTHQKFMIISTDNESKIPHIFFHEIIHYICRRFLIKNTKDDNFEYSYWKSYWETFIDESFTDCLTYRALKKLNWGNGKLSQNIWYPDHIKILWKLIDLASKKLNKTPEYIYNYMMRWYISKWYKWLNLFYQAFWKEFVKWLIDGILTKSKFYKIAKKYKLNIWFGTDKELFEYFDNKTPPSKEIGDVMWIER